MSESTGGSDNNGSIATDLISERENNKKNKAIILSSYDDFYNYRIQIAIKLYEEELVFLDSLAGLEPYTKERVKNRISFIKSELENLRGVK